jgi:hypothetical protein
MGDEKEVGQRQEIGLAEMIETLRGELETAQIRGAERPVAFGIGKVELELKVTVSSKLKAGGGIKFWVVSAEGGAEGGNESVHNFKLTLSPLDANTRKELQVASNKGKTVDRSK